MKKKIGLLWATLGLAALCGIVVLINGIFYGSWMGWYVPLIFGAIAGVAALITRSQPVSSGAHPNLHYPDVAENATPMTMKDGSPITDIVKWYAAAFKCTRETAQDRLTQAQDRGDLTYIELHQKYLSQFKNA